MKNFINKYLNSSNKSYVDKMFMMQLTINEGLQLQIKSLMKRIQYLETFSSGIIADVRQLKDIIADDDDLDRPDFSGIDMTGWGKNAEGK